MAQNGFRIIEARRRQDDKNRAIEASIAAEKRAMGVAKFEQTTTQRIEARGIKLKMEEERGQKNVELHQRRQNLAALYNYEMDQWKTEILSRVETKEERKARIMERAHALKDAREKERQEFVKQMYDDKWRDECDDARTLDSQAMSMYMDKHRQDQIQEKVRRKQAITAEETAFLQYLNGYQAEQDEAERRKQESRSKTERERAGGIQEQIAYNRERKQRSLEDARLEDEHEIQEIRAALDEEELLQQHRQDDERRRRLEVLEYNARYKAVILEKDKVQRQQDEYLLQYALERESAAISSENQKKNADRAAAAQYRKYLEEQMIKEAEDNSTLDDIRRVEERKVWDARDAALDARQRARDELRRLVDEGRIEQIEFKRRQQILEQETDAEYAQKFIQEAREGLEQDRAVERGRRDVNMQNRSQLEEQMALRREMDARERQEAYLSDKHMKYIERQHQQRLQDQGGVVRTFRGLKQSQWYS